MATPHVPPAPSIANSDSYRGCTDLAYLIAELYKYDRLQQMEACDRAVAALGELNVQLGGALVVLDHHWRRLDMSKRYLATHGKSTAAVSAPAGTAGAAAAAKSSGKRKAAAISASAPTTAVVAPAAPAAAAKVPTSWIQQSRRRQRSITPCVTHIEELFAAAVAVEPRIRQQFSEWEVTDDVLATMDNIKIRTLIANTIQETCHNTPDRRHRTLSVHDAFWGGRYLCVDLERFLETHRQKMQAQNVDLVRDFDYTLVVWDQTFKTGFNWNMRIRPNMYRLFYLGFRNRPELMRSFMAVGKMAQFIEANWKRYAELSLRNICDWKRLELPAQPTQPAPAPAAATSTTAVAPPPPPSSVEKEKEEDDDDDETSSGTSSLHSESSSKQE